MKSKLALSALVAASLFGTMTIASAQNEPAQPATPGAAPHATTHHTMKSSHMRHGTTTGMSSRSSKSKPAGQAASKKPAGSY